MPVEPKYLFEPRFLAEEYNNGFNGYKTLIVNAYNVCEKERILQDFNKREIENYLNTSNMYPDVSSITKFLLETNHHLNYESKQKIWNSVAYITYIQSIIEDYKTLDYSSDYELIQSSLPYFITTLEHIHPEVIYVMDDAIAEFLRKSEIPKLEYININAKWSIPIHKFIYDIVPKDSPENILSRITELLSNANPYHCILGIIQDLRMNNTTQDKHLTKLIQPHIWDRQFEKFLYKKQITALLSPDQLLCLQEIMEVLFSKGYTISPSSLEFSPEVHFKKYIKDGIVVEIINRLLIGKGNKNMNLHKNNITELDFVRGLGVNCKDEKEWRYRKKEYTSKILYDNHHLRDLTINFPTVGNVQ